MFRQEGGDGVSWSKGIRLKTIQEERERAVSVGALPRGMFLYCIVRNPHVCLAAPRFRRLKDVKHSFQHDSCTDP